MSITMDPLGTPPYWRENSGESQKNVHIHNFFICYLYWRDVSIKEKEHFFWIPKPGFNLHSRDILISTKKLINGKIRW